MLSQNCPADSTGTELLFRFCSVVYEYGTPNESFEWTQIRGAHSGEVQVLDDTVDLLQVLRESAAAPCSSIVMLLEIS